MNKLLFQANLSAQPAYKQHAAGGSSRSLTLKTRSKAEVSEFLETAKQQGCIGVIVEIVNNQYSGRVTSPEELRVLGEACSENGMILAVDETITAMRCGAPFAYQRPEYKDICSLDLVFFGKALGTNGIGINFQGSYMKRLGILTPERRKQALHDWQAAVTQASNLTVLIDALGILEMATAGDWIGRGKAIGHNLRQIVRRRARSMENNGAESDEEILGGLESFIFVRKDLAATFLVMGASNAGPWVRWVRWLPRMDYDLTEESNLELMMSEKGSQRRKEASQALEQEGLSPPWCFFCGNSGAASTTQRYPWCRACCISVCTEEECTRSLLQHKCLGSGIEYSQQLLS